TTERVCMRVDIIHSLPHRLHSRGAPIPVEVSQNRVAMEVRRRNHGPAAYLDPVLADDLRTAGSRDDVIRDHRGGTYACDDAVNDDASFLIILDGVFVYAGHPYRIVRLARYAHADPV